jgi:GDP-L-fucose synthase
VVGYTGGFHFDSTKPDGMPKKALDASRLRSVGWQAKISLRTGLERTYQWFLVGAANAPS